MLLPEIRLAPSASWFPVQWLHHLLITTTIPPHVFMIAYTDCQMHKISLCFWLLLFSEGVCVGWGGDTFFHNMKHITLPCVPNPNKNTSTDPSNNSLWKLWPFILFHFCFSFYLFLHATCLQPKTFSLKIKQKWWGMTPTELLHILQRRLTLQILSCTSFTIKTSSFFSLFFLLFFFFLVYEQKHKETRHCSWAKTAWFVTDFWLHPKCTTCSIQLWKQCRTH